MSGPRRHNAYAYQCYACRHLMTLHLWNHHDGGTLRDGPYICTDCGCSVTQDAPTLPLTKWQYARLIEVPR